MLQQLYSSVLNMEKLSRKHINTYWANQHSTAQFWREDVKIKVHEGWFLGRTRFLTCKQRPPSPCSLGEGSPVSFSSCENTIPIGLGPHRMTSFHLSYSLKGPNFKYYKTGLRASTYTFGGYTIQSITPYIICLYKMFR